MMLLRDLCRFCPLLAHLSNVLWDQNAQPRAWSPTRLNVISRGSLVCNHKLGQVSRGAPYFPHEQIRIYSILDYSPSLSIPLFPNPCYSLMIHILTHSSLEPSTSVRAASNCFYTLICTSQGDFTVLSPLLENLGGVISE